MEQLKKRRGIIKGKFTRILSYCESPEASQEGINLRIAALEDCLKAFEIVQGQIELELDEEHLNDEIFYRSEIENLYFEIKGRYHQHQTSNTDERQNNSSEQIMQAIDTLVQNQSVLGSIVERINNNASTPINNLVETIAQQNSVQLPRIQLPVFDGNFNNWIRFRDLFESLIHNKQNISNIEKFEYLQGHVRGEALSLIKHLCPSNANYEIGWNLIKNKFNNSELLKRNFLKLLFDQPNMKGAFAGELKRLINNTNESINALKAIGEPVTSWDSILLFHLERKIDAESQALWCRSASNNPSIKQFLEFLEMRLKEFENCQMSKGQNFLQSHKQKLHSNVHALSLKQCLVCQKSYNIFYCDKFKALSVTDRLTLAKKHKLCFNCLEYNHSAVNCSKSTCKICQSKHNTLLHLERLNENSTNNQLCNSVQPLQEKIVNSIFSESFSKIALLPTAIVMVLGSGNNYFPCRALLDTGAQVSLITESCVNQLNLKRQYDKTLLCGIGNNAKLYSKGKVKIVIKSRFNNNSISTFALCVSKLTQQQPICQLKDSDLDYFKDLQFADPSCTIPNRIDIILGADVISNC